MRVLHVVTLISDDGAYGGPARVAINQAEALAKLGHEVTVVAAGVGTFASNVVQVRLFRPLRVIPRSGFAGLAAPGMLSWLLGHCAEFDEVHVHLARDLVTLPAALLALIRGVRVVAQTHGMIDASSKMLARPLDAILTRPVLRRVDSVFYLTERERTDLLGVAGPRVRLQALINGVPEFRSRVESGEVEVLFLARLHPRKRADLFLAMAEVLVSEDPSVGFALVGPDEGDGDMVSARTQPRIWWEGPCPSDQTAERMRSASVYVLPAENEPFPMSVLEAMAVGLPVVVSDTCGLAGAVTKFGCGTVFPTGDLVALTAAVRLLISDADLRAEMGLRGRAAAREHFGTDAVARELDSVYRGV